MGPHTLWKNSKKVINKSKLNEFSLWKNGGKNVERCGKLVNAQFGLDLFHRRLEQRILFDHLLCLLIR